MEFILPAVARLLIVAIGAPARLAGKHLHDAGVRDQSKWKRDLGTAMYQHGFRLTIAIGVLLFAVIPNLLQGKGWFVRSEGTQQVSQQPQAPRLINNDTSRPTGVTRLPASEAGASTQAPRPPAMPLAVAVYQNSRFNFAFTYPAGELYPQGESANGDGQTFSSSNGALRVAVWGERREPETTIEERYAYESRGLTADRPSFVVTYRRQKGNWFVVSGSEKEYGIYRRVQYYGNHVASYEMRWPLSQTDAWRAMPQAVSLREGRPSAQSR